ncbi:MAG: phosphoenolpyruvate--protein phosphotransferase [Candidatus Cloacimonadota bacterium]|nr:MAG: phosphoenolpyruvate--protein phosphotransferase [Candidatus Cloacimonadota bacterium]
MKKIKGISVSEGVAIGKAAIIHREVLHVDRKHIKAENASEELAKFKKDIKIVIAELEHLIQNYAFSLDQKEILSTQKMILADPEFVNRVNYLISEENCSRENAISIYFTEVADIFRNMDNQFFSQRLTDYEDVAYRLLSHILKKGNNRLGCLNDKSILIMDNVTPSFVTRVFEKKIKGIITVKGSRNSHSSIIARSMNLPMLVNASGLLNEVENDQLIIIDGNNGEVIIDPSPEVLLDYENQYKQEQNQKEKLLKLIDVQAKTTDDKIIKLMSNIEIPEEVERVVKYNSDGIGLFRTEFMFIDREELPTEEEQYKIYKQIAEKMLPEPVTIRTIDVGGDKLSRILNLSHEDNPNLGCRGIRISFENIPIFKQQIKAALRANVVGNIKLMFPMISAVSEIYQAKEIIEECKLELKDKAVEFNPDLPIGAMIEIPSAVVTSDVIAAECDFLSIGTNDLVQYILAVDRDNEAVASYYQSCHPSVLRSIQLTAENAHKRDIKVAVCGEMASEPRFVQLLLGLGVDELSVSPGRMLKIKNEILNSSLHDSQLLAEKCLQQKTSAEVMKLLN